MWKMELYEVLTVTSLNCENQRYHKSETIRFFASNASPLCNVGYSASGLVADAVKTYFARKAVKTGQNWFKLIKTWSKSKTQENVPRVVKEPS